MNQKLNLIDAQRVFQLMKATRIIEKLTKLLGERVRRSKAMR